MGNCTTRVPVDEWVDSSDSKLDTEKQAFTIDANDPNHEDSTEGWLLKKSKHLGSWRKRWTLLNKSADEKIFRLETFKDKGMKAKPTETILMDRDIEIQTNETNPTQFIIYQKSTRTEFIFRASSNQRCDEWIRVLRQQLKHIPPIHESEANQLHRRIPSTSIDIEHNKQSYNNFELRLECNTDHSMVNINVKHLKSNQIYGANIENRTETISDLSQYIATAKQQNTLRIRLKECNKLGQMLNLCVNVIQLVLDIDTEHETVIALKPRTEDTMDSDTKSPDTEQEAYKSAILSTRDGPYGSLEGLADRSAFKQQKSIKDPFRQNMKKIMKEIRKDLPNNLYLSYNNGSMFVRFDESNPRFLQTMLIGLQDTPYFNGCFLFDIHLSAGYPSSPPQVKHTTNGANLPTANNGPGGFSPNLHKTTGKVCLSLLGTWSGPGWKANESNVYQILATLLFMVFGAKHPYYMEPNYGGWEGTVNDKTTHDPKVYEYDEELLYHTAKCTILDVLKKPYIGFEDIIKAHFKMKSKQIVEHMKEVMENKDYRKSFKDKIKPIYEQIKIELKKL